ncbi:DUF896 domain-containing protein [Paenibacillus sp. HJGM_3]|uniref:DUF896 domain-containing protein n=1 Tax=Paenibacillus sp. HJGM_3 TaxID=3379816 RepID=UPI00385BCB49
MIPFLGRINQLSRKQRSIGLTEEEKAEQAELRQEFLRLIRGQVRSTMLSLTVVDPEGNDVTPLKLVNEKGESKM